MKSIHQGTPKKNDKKVSQESNQPKDHDQESWISKACHLHSLKTILPKHEEKLLDRRDEYVGQERNNDENSK